MSHYYGRKKQRTTPQFPASPQWAGHSAGLHDESQPYLSEQRQIHPHRDVQRLERLDMDEIAARERQRHFQGAAGMPKYAYPHVRQQPAQDDELYVDDELYTRPPRSAVKYQPLGTHLSGIQGATVNYTSPPPPANTRHAIPPRKSAAYQQPPPQQYREEVYRDDVDAQVHAQPRRRRLPAYWLILFGVALLLMIAGWMALTDLGVWWQHHTDDVTFGMPRTYQTDAVVGHGDSNSNPSHFIAINLHGAIYVIEAPGGNFSKARGYFITTEVGGNPNPPVSIKFADLTHGGKLDMVVTIGDPPNALVVFLFNTGSQFIGKQQQ